MRSGLVRSAAILSGAVLLAACASVRHAQAPTHASAAQSQIIYVVRRGWHVDVGFGFDQLNARLAATTGSRTKPKIVLFGFGDRRYLLARHKSVDGLMAILRPGPALLLVSELWQLPQVAFPEAGVIELRVTTTQMAAAQSALVNSFSDAEPALVAPGPYDGSQYFAAGQRYSAVHTCNTWAAEILKAAGLPIRSKGTLFATQLWLQVRELQDRDLK